MGAVIYGKHPAYGDFLAHGMAHQVFVVLDRWLEGALPKIKAGLADDWEVAWAAAPILRFWIGPGVIGAPLAGLFMASQDKVGRRYPLVFGVTGMLFPPPLHRAHSEDIYDRLQAHMTAFRMPDGGPRGVTTLLDGLDLPDKAAPVWEPGDDTALWAERRDGDLRRLFDDARNVDAQQAQLMRSHWWQPAEPDRAAGWLGATGLPDAEGLTWLLTGRGHAAETARPTQQASEPSDA